MDIHIRIDGEIVDLLALSDEEYAFYQKCLLAFRQNIPYDEYLKIIQEQDSILLKNTPIKKAYQKPLGKAVLDLGDRLAIQQGLKQPPAEYVNNDPCQEEEYISASEAARIKGMKQPSIVAACQKGKIAAHKGSNGRWHISVRSLQRYEVNKTRQANRLGKTVNKSSHE